MTRGNFWVEISWPSPVLERLIRNPDFQGSLILLCPASLYGAGEPSGLELCLYCVVRDIGPRHCHLLMEMNPARRIHKSHYADAEQSALEIRTSFLFFFFFLHGSRKL